MRRANRIEMKVWFSPTIVTSTLATTLVKRYGESPAQYVVDFRERQYDFVRSQIRLLSKKIESVRHHHLNERSRQIATTIRAMVLGGCFVIMIAASIIAP